jgi:hypothetical protein
VEELIVKVDLHWILGGNADINSVVFVNPSHILCYVLSCKIRSYLLEIVTRPVRCKLTTITRRENVLVTREMLLGH